MTLLHQSDLDVARAIGSLESTTKTLVESVASLGAKIEAVHGPLAERVAKLEKWQAWLFGAAACAGAVGTLALKVVL